VSRSLIRQVHRLKHAKYRDSAIEMLRQFDPLVRDFDISSSSGRRPTVYIVHERFGYVPLTVFGDGMRRALALVVAAASAQDGILLLDEFEAGIHFSAFQRVLRVVFRACQHFNVQVFATTHSLEAIDSVLRIEEASLDDIAVFRLPSQTTDSVVTRYSGQGLYELRYESGMEVR
jgi:AAA15 family ATPase/GTPase